MAGLSLLGLGTTARANLLVPDAGSGSGQGLACHVPVYIQPLPEPYPTCGEFNLTLAVKDTGIIIVRLYRPNGIAQDSWIVDDVFGLIEPPPPSLSFRPFADIISLRKAASKETYTLGSTGQADQPCLEAQLTVKVSSKLNGHTITVNDLSHQNGESITFPELRDDSKVMDLIAKAINCQLMTVKWADNNEDSIEWRVKDGCQNFISKRKETTIARIVNRNQSIEVTPVTCHDSEGQTTTVEFLESNFPPCPDGLTPLPICQDIVPSTPSMLTRTVTETTTAACSAPPWQSTTALLPTAAAVATTTLSSLFIALGVVASTVALLLCGSLIAGAWYKHSRANRTQNSQKRRANNILAGVPMIVAIAQ